VLAQLDRALHEAGHRSVVIACEGSRVSGTLAAIPRREGVLDDDTRQRAHADTRDTIRGALYCFARNRRVYY
jgi:hypothetical protein